MLARSLASQRETSEVRPAHEIEALTCRIQKLHESLSEANKSLQATGYRLFGPEVCSDSCGEERSSPEGVIGLMNEALDLFQSQIQSTKDAAERLSRL